MAVVRGTSLSNFPQLVAELGGDPAALLRAQHIRPQDVGNYDAFIPLRAVIQIVESTAAATDTPDFGRRLAQRQGIEILGPVGVAARTAATVGDAFRIFNKYMAAYSPQLAIRVLPLSDPAKAFIEFEILLDRIAPCRQIVEVALGVTVNVLRLMLGSDYSPLSVHLPHDAQTPAPDYRRYFGCRPYFAARRSGFTIRAADLRKPLRRDDVAHRAIVEHLNTIAGLEKTKAASARTIVRQLLPTGAASLEVVARHFNLHPKALQRVLASEGTTFAAVVDQVRKETAERYLSNTEIALPHLARELGYAEQSVLTRSCKRWFGRSPSAYREAMRSTPQRPHSFSPER